MRGEGIRRRKYETEGVPWVTYFTGRCGAGAPPFGWSGYGRLPRLRQHARRLAAKFIYDWTDMGDTVVVRYQSPLSIAAGRNPRFQPARLLLGFVGAVRVVRGLCGVCNVGSVWPGGVEGMASRIGCEHADRL